MIGTSCKGRSGSAPRAVSNFRRASFKGLSCVVWGGRGWRGWRGGDGIVSGRVVEGGEGAVEGGLSEGEEELASSCPV